MARLNSREDLDKLTEGLASRNDPHMPRVSVCAGSGCLACGSKEVIAAFESEIDKQGLSTQVEVKSTGCHGFCEKGPIVVIDPEETCYLQVTPKDVPEIATQTLKDKQIIERLLYVDPQTGEKSTNENDIPFYKHQKRLVFGPNRTINPRSIDDYIAIGGYGALKKALFDMTPDTVIEEIKTSKLRGRGGAGFPTGMKWEFARKAQGDQKYVVVNCDEGDPGAYMDRSLMEGNPHSVLEGLLIGAYAIGASIGAVYIRQEYPLALQNLEVAMAQAQEYGFLGDNILGSGFSFTVEVHRGAGAFVCGEETALLASLEGLAGEPRPRPPFPAQKGWWGRPTNINNVETWSNIPLIIRDGAAAFASIGTEGSKGTKIFSLVGKIANTGLVEVPMGITLRDVIYKIGGGIPDGKKFKAMQTGGPSGGCIPEHLLDLQVGFDELGKAGSMMGSGGLIVMNEDTCMVDLARYYIDFLTEESCGKCVPCREGLRQMHRILTRITEGKGKEGDLELLEQLGETAMEASLCALGKTAPNPFLSTLRYFRDEYEAHIHDKKCPSLACKGLITHWIDPTKCQACMLCLKRCPTGGVDGGKKKIHVIVPDNCTQCGTCFEVCPPKYNAVIRLTGVPVPPPIPEDQRMLVKETA